MVEIENIQPNPPAVKMVETEKIKPSPPVIKWESDWFIVLVYLYLHVMSVFALVTALDAYILTLVYGSLLIALGVIGTTAGAHRLWTHRTYKADTKLRLFLMICQTLTGQGTIYNWVLLHRFHHKHFGTNVDPYNHNKGFLYAHIVSKAIKPVNGYEKLKEEIDMSDIESDCLVMFQKKYYIILYILIVLLLPINTPAEYWGESIWNSILIIGMLRYCLVLHMTWLIESATKIWSERYKGKENLVELIEKGDWISYHYVAPWDYQTGEYGSYNDDYISKFIRMCSRLGIASDLKTMDGQTVGRALQISAETNKPVSECLLEAQCLDTKNTRYNM